MEQKSDKILICQENNFLDPKIIFLAYVSWHMYQYFMLFHDCLEPLLFMFFFFFFSSHWACPNEAKLKEALQLQQEAKAKLKDVEDGLLVAKETDKLCLDQQNVLETLFLNVFKRKETCFFPDMF